MPSKSEVTALLAAIERQVRAAPSRCFTLAPDGTATLHVTERSYHCGRFELPTIGELEQRSRPGGGTIAYSVRRGTGPETDIGTLQATATPGSLFQVASQFNCLEAMGAAVTPIAAYPGDSTQGPRASVSAFPGTFLRHYFAPRASGERFVQTDANSINLLADAVDPRVANVRSGYLRVQDIPDLAAMASSLEAGFEQIRVGLHDDIEVALGTNWGGAVATPPPRIAQVFTSTIALGGYSRRDGDAGELERVRQQLLRAAYLGTLLGAIALGKQRVVLTLIGGGAFGNPIDEIWAAIHWAVARATPRTTGTLEVIVNARDAPGE